MSPSRFRRPASASRARLKNFIQVIWSASFTTCSSHPQALAFAVGVGLAGAMLSDRWLRRTVVASAVLMAGVGIWLVVAGATGRV